MNATVVARRTSSQGEWFASWFDSAHYHALYAHRDEAEAAALIDRLIGRLQPYPGAAVLDLGCGTGRHSKQLASKGLVVTGLDLSTESLRRAGQSESSTLRFVRQDMRRPFGIGTFDYVFNLFTSFGYFDDPADHVTVIHNIARSLKPGGRVVLDYLNARHVENHLRREEVTERGGVAYQLSRWTDRDHIFKRIAIDDRRGGPPLEFVERVAKLSVEEFRFMFALCDMRIDATFGDYRLAPFDVEMSPRLIILATKRDGLAEVGLPARQVLADAADGLRRDAEIRREHGLRDPECD